MNYWRITKIIVTALSLCYATQVLSAELYVISNQDLTVEPTEVKAIFQGDTQFIGSNKLEPTDNTSAQTVFLSKVMDMDKDKYNTIWVKKSFQDGVSQPPVRGTDAEVIEFVKKTPGGIGYVITQPTGVKVIQQY